MSKRKARQLSGLPATIEEAETAQLAVGFQEVVHSV
jgi:hypothetical protein